jgi:hypothetical protein
MIHQGIKQIKIFYLFIMPIISTYKMDHTWKIDIKYETILFFFKFIYEIIWNILWLPRFILKRLQYNNNIY